jgi:hypothetical protein
MGSIPQNTGDGNLIFIEPLAQTHTYFGSGYLVHGIWYLALGRCRFEESMSWGVDELLLGTGVLGLGTMIFSGNFQIGFGFNHEYESQYQFLRSNDITA